MSRMNTDLGLWDTDVLWGCEMFVGMPLCSFFWNLRVNFGLFLCKFVVLMKISMKIFAYFPIFFPNKQKFSCLFGNRLLMYWILLIYNGEIKTEGSFIKRAFGYLARFHLVIWPKSVWFFGALRLVLVSSLCTLIAKEKWGKCLFVRFL